MARNDNPVIRAMALICLARQDISRYEQTIHTYDTDTAEVAYNPAGCGIFRTTLDKLARNIIEDPNLLDYWSPAHTERMTKTLGPNSDKEEWVRQGAEVVKLLLGEGTDINVKDQRGDSPLHYAAAHGDTHFVKLLIANGAGVNARNHSGETALFTAVRWGYQNVVEMLLANGAGVNMKDGGGRTPLNIAVDMDYHALSNLLREKGARE